jgi:hypothetical protein
MINSIVIIILIATIGSLLVTRKIDLFQVFIFFLPFSQLAYDIGLTIYLYQLILLLLILIILFKYRDVVISNTTMYLYLLYVVVSTMLISTFFIDEYLGLGGYFRSNGRFISQIIFYLLMFSIVFVSSHYIRKNSSFLQYFKIYIASIAVLCLLGFVQVLMFYFVGHDVFPLSIVSGLEREPAIFGRTIGLYVFRMSSFAGEPKSLAVHAVAAYFILQVFNYNKIRLFSLDNKLKVLFVCSLLATLSTGGYVLFTIIFIVVMVMRLFTSNSLSFRYINKGTIFGFTILLFTGLIWYIFYDLVSIVFQNRILDRDIFSEDFDYVVKSFLINNPDWIYFGSGLGNIHNLSADYIPDKSLRYMADSIFVAKSGYLRLLSELGAVGLILFLSFNYAIYHRLGIHLKSNIGAIDKRYIRSIRTIFVVVTLMYLARGYAFGIYIIFLSIINSLAYWKGFYYRRKI